MAPAAETLAAVAQSGNAKAEAISTAIASVELCEDDLEAFAGGGLDPGCEVTGRSRRGDE